MGTLTVGRVGLSTPTIRDHRDWRIGAGGRRTIHRVSGSLLSTSLANTKALRQELVNQIDKLIAVTYSEDSSYDGFYVLRGVDVDARHRLGSLQGVGLFEYDLDLEWVGDHSSVEFLSNLTGVLVTNDHGITDGEQVYWHAPPVAGDDAYTAGGGTDAISRTTEDGAIPVFTGLTFTNGLAAAKWGCSPANFYKGAARIDVNGYTRTGKNAPMTPDSFVLGNGLIEVRAEESGGTTIGDIGIRAYNGTWGSWTPFDIVWNSTVDIPEWHYFTIVRNDPEVCTIRLVRDADESPPTDNRHTLDITLRRGSQTAACYYTYSSAVPLTIDRASTDAGVNVTPTGGSSVMAIVDSANDGDGNQWIVGSSNTDATDTTNGGIDLASSATHDFFLGFVIDGTSATGDDTAEALCLQYLGWTGEIVQATRR